MEGGQSSSGEPSSTPSHSSHPPLTIFNHAKAEIDKELRYSKYTVNKSLEKFPHFEAKADSKDEETKKFVDVQRDFLNRFQIRVAEIESKYADSSPASQATAENASTKLFEIIPDYVNLANFRRSQEEAYLAMYSHPRTGLIRNRSGEYG